MPTAEPSGSISAEATAPADPAVERPVRPGRSVAERARSVGDSALGVLRTQFTRWDSRRYWLRLLPVVLLLTALTRLPSFFQPIWNPDEGFLATQARMLAAGGVMYETVVDRKPPLAPLLYRGAFALFGDQSLWPLRVLAVLAVAATALLVASIARRRWGNRAGATAAVLCVLASVGLNPEDAQAANFEIFMLPFTAAAMWCADRGRWTSAGVAVAGAFLVKQTGGAVLIPVLFLLWRGTPRGGARHRALLTVFAGFAVPLVATGLLLGVRQSLFWTVTGSGSYASFTGSELHVLGRGLVNTLIFTVGCLGLVIPLVTVVRRKLAHRSVLTPDLWVWLGASGLAVVTGFHFFGHYYLQLLPPLALLGAGALQLLAVDWLRLAVTCSAVTATVFVGWAANTTHPGVEHSQRLAKAVQTRTEPGDRVLFWGMHPEHYWLADRPPASRYLTAGLLTNFSGGRDGPTVGERYGMDGSWPTLLAEMREDPPRVIVDDSRGQPYEPARMPRLKRILAGEYERMAVVSGAVVYVRTDVEDRTDAEDRSEGRADPAERADREEPREPAGRPESAERGLAPPR
ncbi:glycosyltransferase family 39 protein [Streptomyces sp. P38-E01]|uniref:Glycosyltransferase family 39 protein n=1 Tax=Streptomyces tardus TaxID=2780544 RepID=A0A949JKH4_9ACTN|nr:glycosyltransferase family 39 protein [Streptomyces tardus]MBU7600448.1 glycosyltransferase family 39 protein [Streptomyces tardus]